MQQVLLPLLQAVQQSDHSHQLVRLFVSSLALTVRVLLQTSHQVVLSYSQTRLLEQLNRACQ